MPIVPSSGQLKLSVIANVFALSQPYKMSQLIRGGPYVQDGLSANLNIPTTLANIRFQNFFGAIKQIITVDTVARQYPPVELTVNTTNVTGKSYGNGTYVCSSSDSDSGVAYNTSFNPFQYLYGTQGYYSTWQTNSKYNTSTGVYTGTTSTQGYSGEWWQVQLPVPILLTNISYKISAENHALLGSSNGSTWTLLYNPTFGPTSGFDPVTAVSQTFSLTTDYKYFRIVVRKTRGYSHQLSFLGTVYPGKATINGLFVLKGKSVTTSV